MGITTGVIITYGIVPLTFIYDKWVGLVTASLLMSVFQALACYIASFRQGALLALGGNSGNPIYDVRQCASVTQNDFRLIRFSLVLHRARAQPYHWQLGHQVIQRTPPGTYPMGLNRHQSRVRTGFTPWW